MAKHDKLVETVRTRLLGVALLVLLITVVLSDPRNLGHYAGVPSSGEQGRVAAEALTMVGIHLDHPLQHFFIRRLQVVEMIPLPPRTADPTSNQPCRWLTKIRGYSFFWTPVGSYVVWCGRVSGAKAPGRS